MKSISQMQEALESFAMGLYRRKTSANSRGHESNFYAVNHLRKNHVDAIKRACGSYDELVSSLTDLVKFENDDEELLEALHDELIDAEIAPSMKAAKNILIERAVHALNKAKPFELEQTPLDPLSEQAVYKLLTGKNHG